MKNSARYRTWMAMVAVATLSACGGGGGDTSAVPAPAPVPAPPLTPPAPPAPPPAATPLPTTLSVSVPSQTEVANELALSSDLGDGSAGLSFAWDFGDGGGSTQARPTHAWAQAGSYGVTLTVRNDAGASIRASSQLVVWPPVAGLFEPHFVDTRIGMATAMGGIVLVTTDGARTWQRYRTPSVSGLSGLAFADAQHGWVLPGAPTFSGPTPMLRTRDGGQTWQAVTSIPLRAAETPITFGPQTVMSRGLMLDEPTYRTAISTDGGQTWRLAALEVTELTPQGLLIERLGMSIRVSTDWGLTAETVFTLPVWRVVQAVAFDEWPRISLMLDSPVDADFTAPPAPTHYVSSDGGHRWAVGPVTLPSGVRPSLYPSMFAQGLGWAMGNMAAADGGFGATVTLRTVDGGAHWSLFSYPDGLAAASIRVVTFVDGLSQWVNVDNQHWLTTDAGQHWRPVRIDGESDQLLTIKAIGAGVLMASYGTWEYPSAMTSPRPPLPRPARNYLSTDGGQSWRLLPGGAPRV